MLSAINSVIDNQHYTHLHMSSRCNYNRPVPKYRNAWSVVIWPVARWCRISANWSLERSPAYSNWCNNMFGWLWRFNIKCFNALLISSKGCRSREIKLRTQRQLIQYCYIRRCFNGRNDLHFVIKSHYFIVQIRCFGSVCDVYCMLIYEHPLKQTWKRSHFYTFASHLCFTFYTNRIIIVKKKYAKIKSKHEIFQVQL